MSVNAFKNYSLSMKLYIKNPKKPTWNVSEEFLIEQPCCLEELFV